MSEPHGDVLSRMRSDWDLRATEDHKLHIATGHAGSEETFRASGEQDLEGIVLDGVVLERSAEVLEIGCGVGRLLVPLAARVAVAHGVDISPVMIEKSKTYAADAPNVRTALTDGTLAYLANASLDFVFSFIVFQHIPDRKPIRRYVEEAARVLKPGGVFRFQVDGRWWWKHAEGGPDTYQGVKFSPKDARALLAGTPFSVVDEWGAEGHYHWITARKAGDGAAASVRPRGWDLPLFASLLRRLGSKTPEEDAAKIRGGTESLRPHLLDLVQRFSAADPAAFVLEAYHVLLGSTVDDAGRAFHLSILEKGFEDRAALLDTVTTSRGFLDLYRPFVPEIPWFAACEIFMRLGEAPRTGDLFELVRAVTSRLEGRPPPDAIAFGFKIILGFEADEGAFRHHLSQFEDHPDGHWLLIRNLLLSRRYPAPPAEEDPHAALLAGESAPGEAALSVNVLTESCGADDRSFVSIAYERLFGRAADAEGEAFYLGKLSVGELSRPGFLRELSWSEEGRARNGRLRGAVPRSGAPWNRRRMLARRLLPLVGLVALVAFLVLRLPAALADSWSRVRDAWRDRALDADSALARVRGPEYVAAIHRIRDELPADSEYLLLAGGGDVFVRFDLAPRRAIFGGEPKDVAHNVTPAKLPTLPEWTVIPRLDPPGPRLVKTRLLAEKGAVP